MDIEEVKNKYTRDEFMNELEKSRYGNVYEFASCPKDIGLKISLPFCSVKYKRCKECWTESTKFINFKNEKLEKYECLRTVCGIFPVIIYFSNRKVYEAIENNPNYVIFIGDDKKEHRLSRSVADEAFRKIEVL